MMLHDPEDMLGEQVPPKVAICAELLAGFRKWLTREAGAEDIVGRDSRGADVTNVAFRLEGKIALVQILQGGIQFGREDALVSEGRER